MRYYYLKQKLHCVLKRASFKVRTRKPKLKKLQIVTFNSEKKEQLYASEWSTILFTNDHSYTLRNKC